MATARAIANGNWSATSTWNGGVLPGNGDTVYPNGFTVTVDTDVNIGGSNNPTVNTGSLVSGQWYEIVNVGGQNWTSIGAASNTAGTVFLATGTGTAGNLGTAKAIATLSTSNNTAAGATTGGGTFVMPTVRVMTCDLRGGVSQCLNVTATTGTLTLSGIRAVGGSGVSAHALNNNSTATIELVGGTYTGGSGGSALNNASTGIVNITSACTFTGGANAAAYGLNNAAGGTVNVSASCTFTGGSTGSAAALNNASTGTVNVTSSCTFNGSSGNCFALNNASSGTINISAACVFTAGSGSTSPGLNNASVGTVIVTSGTFTASAFGNAVVLTNTSADVRLSGDFLDHWSGWKAVSGGKWRLGTTPTAARTRYALNGTTDSYVTMFTADNTGFGLPAATDVRSGVSYGGGSVIGACAVPSPSAVAFSVPVDSTTGTAILTPAALRAELATELARIDAPISAAGNAPSASTVASAVWGAAARTITGGTVDTLVNSPDVPTESEIANAVWNKPTTELTVSGSIGERAKNQSTVSTTGAQLAAALS